MSLNERFYICKSCKSSIDRDLNASINILQEGLRVKEISTERRCMLPERNTSVLNQLSKISGISVSMLSETEEATKFI